ncbi:MAG: hypothetical protein ACOCRX_00780 [Candidatus Woesearchaeota archaeon]
MTSYEKILAIIEAIKNIKDENKNKENDINIIKELLDEISVDIGNILKFSYVRFIKEGDEDYYIEQYSNAKKLYKSARTSLSMKSRILNRMCVAYNIEPLFTNISDRIQTENEAMELMQEMFLERNISQ